MENKHAEISRISINFAENGFTYRVDVDTKGGEDCPSMESHEYVYEDIEDVLKAVRDDLGSPHYRKEEDKEEPEPEKKKQAARPGGGLLKK